MMTNCSQLAPVELNITRTTHGVCVVYLQVKSIYITSSALNTLIVGYGFSIVDRDKLNFDASW